MKQIKDFYQDFEHFLRNKCNVLEPTTILVAVSGGADSMALLHLFMKAGFKCFVAHCNFSLRGAESDNDEQFVIEICKNLNVECFAKTFDTTTFAKENKISIEMAARELRYKWFNELATKLNIDFIATGHHAEDAIETFFLNLARGTGIRGLTGISPRKGKIIRPLLFAFSEDVRTFCSLNQIEYRTDSTNLKTNFNRNKIRNLIIPLFKEINPSFLRTMKYNIECLVDSYIFIEKETEIDRKELITENNGIIYVSKQKLIEYPQKISFLFDLLHKKRFSRTMVKNIAEALTKPSGKQFISKTHRLIIDRNNLILTTLEEIENKNYFIPYNTDFIDVPIKLSFKIFHQKSDFRWSENPLKATLDADLIKFPLQIRKALPGDRFRPLGMKTFKKVSDFFTDEKYDILEKEQTWLLFNKSEIIWIIGKRIDDRYKVTPRTRRIIEFTLSLSDDTTKIS
ncbi:MAG: tRNA lysidine(34) synthetase TilS [Marinilabiliaceae bacterium]|nr:tRNA lysidine(34) synthetase TilS [Marinilabiliaceae bacterium]